MCLFVVSACVGVTDIFESEYSSGITQQVGELPDPQYSTADEMGTAVIVRSVFPVNETMNQVMYAVYSDHPIQIVTGGEYVLVYIRQPGAPVYYDALQGMWMIDNGTNPINTTFWYFTDDQPGYTYGFIEYDNEHHIVEVFSLDAQPHDPVTPISYEFSVSGDVVTRHAYCGNLYSAYVFFQHYGRTDCSSANNWCQGADINRDGSADDTDLAIIQGSNDASCGAPTQTYYHIPPGEYIEVNPVANWTTASIWFRVLEQSTFGVLVEYMEREGLAGTTPMRQVLVRGYPDYPLGERTLSFMHGVDDVGGSCDVSGRFDIEQDRWYHLVIVRDQRYAVYLDGEQVIDAPGCDEYRSITQQYFGSRYLGGSQGTGSGDIALAQYYTQPLSSTQVAELYAQQLSAFVGDR